MCPCICVYAQFCPILCNPIDWSPVSSLFLYFLKMLFRNRLLWNFQARILEQIAISFSRGSPCCRDQVCVSCVSCIGERILLLCTTRQPTEARAANRFLSLWLSCFVWLTFLLLLHYIREILVSIPPRDVTKT